MDSERLMNKIEPIAYEKLKQKWKDYLEEDIILDALYLNCTRYAQEYFEKVLKIELKSTRILEIGLKSALQLLADRDLNFDSNTKIRQICFYTPYKELRDYLTAVLNDRKLLTDEEIKIIDYLKFIENTNTCESYTKVKENKKYNWTWSKTSRHMHNWKFNCGDLVKLKNIDEVLNLNTFNYYGNFVLEWLREWSDECQNNIAIDNMISNKKNSLIYSINGKVLWSYILEHLNFDKINKWISYSFENNTELANDQFQLKLNDKMIEQGHEILAKYGVDDYLLNKLAEYNRFVLNEKEHFPSHINRLSSSLTFYNYPKSIDFGIDFVKYLLVNDHVDLLWTYVENYGENVLREFSNANKLKSKTLSMLSEFHKMSTDESNLNAICMSNIECILNDDCKMETLFDNSRLQLNALALFLNNDNPVPSNVTSKLQYLIEKYPALRLVIDYKNFQASPSLYSMLQTSNTIALKEDNEHNQKLFEHNILSFDNKEFAKRYAYKDQLDYGFFLKQGRPFFAYNTFTNYQLNKYGKLNRSPLDEAGLRAHIIAIQNYESNRIVSSCIVFSELVNGNQFKIKLHIYLMKHILYDYYKKRGLNHYLSSERCKTVMLDFLKGEIEAKRLATTLENALVTLMSENFDQKKMFTMSACSLWLPVMCFCKIYSLPFSAKYLHLCAESNNWLMYLMFAQLYQVPKFQVLSNLEHFTDVGLKQHLDYALHNVISSASNKSSNKEISKQKKPTGKTSKSKKYMKKSRIKVNTSDDDSDQLSDSESHKNEKHEKSKAASNSNQLDSIDFYELLINCQNSTDPIKQLQIEALRWNTPVLAVFATFYAQYDKISCLCTFLYASLKIEYIESNCKNDKHIVFGLDDLKMAIQTTALRGFLKTLLNSLKIFMLGSILDIYVDFLYHVFVVKDTVKAQQLYSNYKYELIKVTLSKHQSYVPLEWYEDVISKLTRITILKSNTIEDLKSLTSILSQLNEYKKLIKLVYILKSNKLSVNSEDWLTLNDKSDRFTEICLRVIEELLKINKFNEAEDLADYCELSKDRIHLARIGRQIDVLRLNNDFEEILVFWKSAHVELMKIGIKDAEFIDFLKFQNSRSNLTLEKIVLLNLICQLHPNDQDSSKNLWLLLMHLVVDYKKRNELNNLREIFKKMLLFGKLDSNPIKELINSILADKCVVDFSNSASTLNEQNTEALNILLYNLIDIGKLSQSYVIAKYFKYFNQDLRILLNILYISLNMIQPKDLDYSAQAFDSTSFKGIKLTNVLKSLSLTRSADSNETIKDRIDCLEKLTGLCNHGQKYCQQIKSDFRLANELLKVDYKQIVDEDKWTLLRCILNSVNKNKYNLAKDFVFNNDLDQDELCVFLLDEILLALKSYANNSQETNSKIITNKSKVFDPSNNEEFSSLIKIFKNSTTFGMKLLEKTKSMLSDGKTTKDYIVLTELLIRSHDCFIQSCSMEGISNVLQVCKKCALKLEKAGEFNLMIRLLIGIEHFNEMTYIMDYLWNNHQFEMLFGKRIGKNEKSLSMRKNLCFFRLTAILNYNLPTKKESKLRLALLDYLKRYHPNDNETYTMVTLNFTMHREIAQMLEEAAYQQLRLLEKKQIENTAEILTDLQSILQYFSDAAHSYMKEDCVKQVELCVRKARLVGLQISFLSSNRIVVNLNSAAVSKFIANNPKFWESHIVNEAYDRKTDWSHAIFNQYIMKNNEKYLNDYKGHLTLTTNLIEDVANRFKAANELAPLSPVSVSNMKKLLKNCKDITAYYRLSYQLDFKDSINEILTKDYASVINDLILNKKLI